MTNSRIWYSITILFSATAFLWIKYDTHLLYTAKEIVTFSLHTTIFTVLIVTILSRTLKSNNKGDISIPYEVTSSYADRGSAYVHIVLQPLPFSLEPKTDDFQKIVKRIVRITKKRLDAVDVSNASIFNNPYPADLSFSGTIPAHTKIDVSGEIKIESDNGKHFKVVKIRITPEGSYPRIRVLYTATASEITDGVDVDAYNSNN